MTIGRSAGDIAGLAVVARLEAVAEEEALKTRGIARECVFPDISFNLGHCDTGPGGGGAAPVVDIDVGPGGVGIVVVDGHRLGFGVRIGVGVAA